MPTVFKRSLPALFAALLLVFVTLTAYAAPATTAPAATDAPTPVTSSIGVPDSTAKLPDSTSTVPDSSSMMDTPLTTTPDTANDPATTSDLTDKNDDDGFAYTGLVIALIIAALVIGLIILLVPKNKDKQ